MDPINFTEAAIIKIDAPIATNPDLRPSILIPVFGSMDAEALDTLSIAQANPSIDQTEPSCAQSESLERFNDDDLSLEDTAMIEIAHDVDSATSTPMHDEENYYADDDEE